MAAHCASGVSWHGHRVKGGPVLYVAFEGAAGMRNRLAPLRHRFGDAPLAVLRGGLDLCNDQSVEALIALAQDAGRRAGAPVAQIWIDTLARAMGGKDENSPDGMGLALKGAGRLQAATGGLVVLVHHTGKDATRGARGHSSLKGAVDAEISVVGHGNTITATADKVRDGEDGAEFRYHLRTIPLGLDRDGEHITTCEVEPATGPDAHDSRDPLPPKQRLTLEALRQFIDDHGTPNPGGTGFPEPGRMRTVEFEAFIEFASDKSISTAERPRDRKRETRRMIEGLVENGYTQMNARRVWITGK